MKDILPLANVADSKDNIVVVLDTDKMMENNKFSLASNILYKSLFSPEAVKKINEMASQLNVSMNPVDVYQIVKLKIQSLEHQNSTFTNFAEDNLQYCLYTHLSICPTLYCPKTE